MKTLSIVAIIACVFLLLGRPAAAQETTGTISGRAVDTQGLILPGVTITATGPQGVKTTVTDGEGRFTLAFLTPGPYTVHADLQGFTAVDRPNVVVRVGQNVDVPLTMQILPSASAMCTATSDGCSRTCSRTRPLPSRSVYLARRRQITC